MIQTPSASSTGEGPHGPPRGPVTTDGPPGRLVTQKGVPMRQAIETKFMPGTERFPCGRIRARCQAGRVLVEVNSQLSEDGNHLAAAKALMAKLGWDEWATSLAVGGSADGQGNVYVVLGDERPDDDTIVQLRSGS